ncbi:hypothetical protein M406DRAFT_61871 [Cryphonectria parasitica EP155]|uniref:Uncharacterized protein n=1 Tax=Cryphonectria parasitica (strain ATCC 38755 / EP155) TaxID=660469 RepID=A0A9P5CNI2_CRYP1|nr:uncharacterized protein M406DRAFT_61871 [Cryphonectria parasitica EP155]KAF3765168.1 hypothetical protein M406DRAFT_61871 [Cryphonectria parasitica EP155]
MDGKPPEQPSSLAPASADHTRPHHHYGAGRRGCTLPLAGCGPKANGGEGEKRELRDLAFSAL